MSRYLLVDTLGQFLRPGAVDEVGLTRTMNLTISPDRDGGEPAARTLALLAMASAMLTYIERHWRSGNMLVRLLRGRRMHRLTETLNAFSRSMRFAPRDADADMLRIRALQLALQDPHLSTPITADLSAAVRAMGRVALAGTSPVPQPAWPGPGTGGIHH